MGKFWDEHNTTTCSRCGGACYFPYQAYGGRCFKCLGRGWVPVTPKGQAAMLRKQHITVVDLADANVGDVIKVEGTAARVTEIVWRKPSQQMLAPTWNQSVRVARLLDGAKHAVGRTVMTTARTRIWNVTRDADGNEVSRTPMPDYAQVTDAMVGKPAEQDEHGEWIVFGELANV